MAATAALRKDTAAETAGASASELLRVALVKGLNAGAQDIMRIVRTRAAHSGSGSPPLPPGESAHNPPHYVE